MRKKKKESQTYLDTQTHIFQMATRAMLANYNFFGS